MLPTHLWAYHRYSPWISDNAAKFEPRYAYQESYTLKHHILIYKIHRDINSILWLWVPYERVWNNESFLLALEIFISVIMSRPYERPFHRGSLLRSMYIDLESLWKPKNKIFLRFAVFTPFLLLMLEYFSLFNALEYLYILNRQSTVSHFFAQ